MSELNRNVNNIDQYEQQKEAPWKFENLKFDVSLSRDTKANTTSEEYKSKFKEIITSKYKTHIKFYTDGSVQDEKSAYAIYSDNYEFSKRLANYSSIFTAEMKAIEQCLKHIDQNEDRRKFIIITDSLSSIIKLKSLYDQHPIVTNIKDLIAKSSNKQITLFWCPGHVEIEGNEKADSKAKEALKQDEEHDKFIWHDYRQQIKKYIYDIWSKEFNDLTNNKLKEIIPIPCKRFENYNLNRQDRQIITRLRIGHTNLTHKHYMENTDPPKCECGTDNLLTVKHIFNNCTRFSKYKRQYKIKDITSLSNPSNFENIIKFLKKIDLYGKI